MGLSGPPKWPNLSWGSRPASYSCEVLVLVAAVMGFLRLRFVAIILMARSPTTIATPIFSPYAVGGTLKSWHRYWLMLVSGRAIYCIEGIACSQRPIRVDFLDMSPYACGKA